MTKQKSEMTSYLDNDYDVMNYFAKFENSYSGNDVMNYFAKFEKFLPHNIIISSFMTVGSQMSELDRGPIFPI